MSLKDKIMNIITAHPKLGTLGIGLAITFVVISHPTTMVSHDAFAFTFSK